MTAQPAVEPTVPLIEVAHGAVRCTDHGQRLLVMRLGSDWAAVCPTCNQWALLRPDGTVGRPDYERQQRDADRQAHLDNLDAKDDLHAEERDEARLEERR